MKALFLFILLLSFFFRVYRFGDYYSFELDQEINSFIVKDIVVNNHQRLVGQMSSIDGLFVGSLFNYLQIPFYIFFKMDPIGMISEVAIVGFISIFSIYYVASKFFTKSVANVGILLYAISLPIAFLDRWVVSSQLVLLWSIWFIFAIFSLLKRKYKSLILLAILAGLTWHIHPSLIPLLTLPLILLLISLINKKLKFSQVLLPILILIPSLLPFFLFETRHQFIQTKAIYELIFGSRAATDWFQRINMITSGITGSIGNAFFAGLNIWPIFHFLALASVIIFIYSKKLLATNQLIVIISWFIVMILSQLFSSRPLTDYYFNNLIAPNLLLFSLVIAKFYSSYWKKPVVLVLTIFMVFNILQLFKKPPNPFSYHAKLQTVEFIKNDSAKKGYPCIAIDYLTDPGRANGFRYLFWLKGVSITKPTSSAPLYKIALPEKELPDNIDIQFAKIGIIVPKNQVFENFNVCQDPKNQLDPLWGLVS